MRMYYFFSLVILFFFSTFNTYTALDSPSSTTTSFHQLNPASRIRSLSAPPSPNTLHRSSNTSNASSTLHRPGNEWLYDGPNTPQNGPSNNSQLRRRSITTTATDITDSQQQSLRNSQRIYTHTTHPMHHCTKKHIPFYVLATMIATNIVLSGVVIVAINKPCICKTD